LRQSFIKKFTSVLITVIVLTMLLLAGPASAMTVSLSAPSNPNPVRGEVVEFDADIQINTNERVPITSMSVAFSDLTICYFEVDGTLMSGCEGVTVTPTGNTAGFGPGYGYNPFPGYGYGYNTGYTQGALSYHISINTSRFAPGQVLLWYQANYNANPSQSSNAGDVTVESPQVSMIVDALPGTENDVFITSGQSQVDLLINGTGSVYLDLSLLTVTNGTVTLPELNLVRNNSGTLYNVHIPSGTVLTASDGWDSRLLFPEEAIGSFSISSGSVNLVVDVGAGVELNFSTPVKVTLPGQAGMLSAWTRNSVLTPITTVCDSASNPTNINTVSPRECAVSVGSDLVIWTTHFTSFGSYTPSPAPSSGGSGGSRGFGPIARPTQAKEAPVAANEGAERVPDEVSFDGPVGQENAPDNTPVAASSEGSNKGNGITGRAISDLSSGATSSKKWIVPVATFVIVAVCLAGFYFYKSKSQYEY
jgi:hypothetical protein